MRQLNSDELLDKFTSYSNDIAYANFDNVDIKINHLFNFLNEQEIAKRILERISEEFSFLNEKMNVDIYQRDYQFYENLKAELKTRELQGAMAYFAIKEKFEIEKKISHHYIELCQEFYDAGGEYREMKDEFITYFWSPFHEIFEWYLYESETKIDIDYFSKRTQENLYEKLSDMEIMLDKLGYGQEVVFNEIADLRKLTKKLNKKNWNEIIMGKFVDLGLSGIISSDVATKVIESLTGNEIKLLP